MLEVARKERKREGSGGELFLSRVGGPQKYLFASTHKPARQTAKKWKELALHPSEKRRAQSVVRRWACLTTARDCFERFQTKRGSSSSADCDGGTRAAAYLLLAPQRPPQRRPSRHPTPAADDAIPLIMFCSIVYVPGCQ